MMCHCDRLRRSRRNDIGEKGGGHAAAMNTKPDTIHSVSLFIIESAGQSHTKTIQFLYQGDVVPESANLSVEIKCGIPNMWA